MKRPSLLLMCALMALAMPLAAQEGQGAGQGSGQGAGRSSLQPVNVQLEITINDQTASGQPLKKSVSLLLADGFDGRVRSTGLVHVQIPAGRSADNQPQFTLKPLFEVELNVDASVRLLQDSRVRAAMTIQYTPGIAGATMPAEAARPTPLNQTVTVILVSGKPLVITQAADPLSDRKVTVEVTATILR